MFVDIPAGYRGTFSPKLFRLLVTILVVLVIVLGVIVYRNRFASVSPTRTPSDPSASGTETPMEADIRRQLKVIGKREASHPTPAPTATDIQGRLDAISKANPAPSAPPTAAEIQAELDAVAARNKQ